MNTTIRNKRFSKKWRNPLFFISLGMVFLLLTGCATPPNPATSSPAQTAQPVQEKKNTPPKKVQLLLDWTPNTNHTGIYVAQQKGYFKEQGLEVEILQPSMGSAETIVATEKVAFGVSYQEAVTFARTQGVPLVSIAAVIQHNTSGFASDASLGIDSPKKFAGKTYGGWGSPIEQAMIEALMKADGADAKKVKTIQLGNLDFFTASEQGIDFQWIYYGWTGIEAKIRKKPLNIVWLTDYAKSLDYYTPVIVTSEAFLGKEPDTVRRMMAALSKGYNEAVTNPKGAAQALLDAVPELNKELVYESAQWLNSKYIDDAPRWGEQRREIWENYAQWMKQANVLKGEFDAKTAFTNEFLP